MKKPRTRSLKSEIFEWEKKFRDHIYAFGNTIEIQHLTAFSTVMKEKTFKIEQNVSIKNDYNRS